MESPFLHPSFLLSAAGAVVALVVWFIRLESRASNNRASIERIEADIRRLQLEIEEHRQNAEIHFDKRITQQVDERYTERFRRIETDIHEIKEMLKEFRAEFSRGSK